MIRNSGSRIDWQDTHLLGWQYFSEFVDWVLGREGRGYLLFRRFGRWAWVMIVLLCKGGSGEVSGGAGEREERGVSV